MKLISIIHQHRISTKVILSLVCIVLIQGIFSLIGISILISRNSRDSFDVQMERNLQGIERYLTETLNDLTVKTNLLAGQQNVIDYTEYRLKNMLTRELYLFKQPMGIDSIIVFTDSADLFVEIGRESVHDGQFRAQIDESFNGGRRFFISRQPFDLRLWVVSQIKRGDRPIGLLCVSLELDRKFINRLENVTNSIAMLVFNEDVVDTFRLNPDLRYRALVMSKGLGAEDGSARSGNLLLGSIGLSAFGEPDAHMLSIIDMQESADQIRKYNLFSLLFTFLVLSSAIGLGTVFYQHNLLHPLQVLQDGVRKISEGNLQYPISPIRDDEIGDLAQGFDRMRQNLLVRERELSEMIQYNRLLLENVRSGILTVTLDGKISTCNHAVSRITASAERIFTGMPLSGTPLPQSLVAVIDDALHESRYVTMQECRIVIGGEPRILLVSTSPFLMEGGRKTGIIAVFADITHERKLENELAISQRLAEMGEMVAGVAHQIRNPLGIMKVSAEMLRDSFSPVANRGNYSRLTKMLVNEIDSLNLVVCNFLDFARPLNMKKERCSVSELIDDSLGLIPRISFADVDLEVSVAPEAGEYTLDRNSMEQVVSNLLLNALQASSPGTRVSVRASISGGRLCLEVQDEGSGMDDETVRNIFNPFFTTKDKGTGLGLSIVHRIVREHGGTIDLYSEPGRGTVFKVLV